MSAPTSNTTAAIKATCTDSELLRFACCFLHSEAGVINWEAASAAFNPETKPESFKTMTNKALSRVKKVLKEGGAVDTSSAGTPGGKAKGKGGKRKAAAETERGNEEEAPKAKKVKGGAGMGNMGGKKNGEGFTALNGEEGQGELISCALTSLL